MSNIVIRRLPIFVFDIGGVVIRWPRNDPIFRYVAKRYHVPISKMKKAMQDDLPLVESGKMDTGKYMRVSLERVGRKLKKNDTAEELLSHPFENLVELNEGTVRLINSLRSKGHRVFALTNTSPPHVEVMKRLGWTSFFDGFFASCELNSIKPEKRIYLLMLKAIQAKPGDIVFIDDREENIRGAEDAGISCTILFRGVQAVKSEISNLTRD